VRVAYTGRLITDSLALISGSFVRRGWEDE
jgi:hypothetical protein